jgi:nicotinate phosphoribosyltransferase
MQQAVIHLFPDLIVQYKLIIRTKRNFPDNFADMFRQQVEMMSTLSLRHDEYNFLKKTYFFKAPYIDFLRGYRFNSEEVTILQKNDTIELIIEGPWYRTILWETPLMATISELFFMHNTEEKPWPMPQRINKMKEKAKFFERRQILYADFGSRRRYSYTNHEKLVQTCRRYSPKSFIGTSNPYLAMKYDTKMIGTQAHEFFMVMAALYGYLMANRLGLEKWVDVYQGDLGIALTDTFTTDVFFRDFTTKYAKLFDGVRQDSGDPFVFSDKAIAHYEKLRIDPKSKTIVFSDSLNPDMVEKIHDYCDGRIKDVYGIGTNLTNDVGVKALNIVIKLTAVLVNNTWQPTTKLSDDAGKHLGPVQEVELCKKTLDI